MKNGKIEIIKKEKKTQINKKNYTAGVFVRHCYRPAGVFTEDNKSNQSCTGCKDNG